MAAYFGASPGPAFNNPLQTRRRNQTERISKRTAEENGNPMNNPNNIMIKVSSFYSCSRLGIGSWPIERWRTHRRLPADEELQRSYWAGMSANTILSVSSCWPDTLRSDRCISNNKKLILFFVAFEHRFSVRVSQSCSALSARIRRNQFRPSVSLFTSSR